MDDTASAAHAELYPSGSNGPDGELSYGMVEQDLKQNLLMCGRQKLVEGFRHP
jgi:hypothetical protein